MPSPIGHALAGVAIAWIADASASQRQSNAQTSGAPRSVGLTVGPATCAMLAVFPDIDLLYLPIHRTVTHSITAVIVVTIVAAGVTGWVTGRISWRAAMVCGLAYLSHIVMDWFGADASRPYGVQLFWPFSDRWFVSPLPIFPGTERRNPLGTRAMLINLRAAVTELVLCGSVVALAWLRRTRRSRDPISVPVDRPPPSV